MLTTLLKWIADATFLDTALLSSTRTYAALLLVVWALAIGVFAYLNLRDRFLWIPVVLALAGVFGSTVALAIPGATTLVVNGVTLVIFVVSLELLKTKRRSIAVVRHHAG
jgi:hypothetical protein